MILINQSIPENLLDPDKELSAVYIYVFTVIKHRIDEILLSSQQALQRLALVPLMFWLFMCSWAQFPYLVVHLALRLVLLEMFIHLVGAR